MGNDDDDDDDGEEEEDGCNNLDRIMALRWTLSKENPVRVLGSSCWFILALLLLPVVEAVIVVNDIYINVKEDLLISNNGVPVYCIYFTPVVCASNTVNRTEAMNNER